MGRRQAPGTMQRALAQSMLVLPGAAHRLSARPLQHARAGAAGQGRRQPTKRGRRSSGTVGGATLAHAPSPPLSPPPRPLRARALHLVLGRPTEPRRRRCCVVCSARAGGPVLVVHFWLAYSVGVVRIQLAGLHARGGCARAGCFQCVCACADVLGRGLGCAIVVCVWRALGWVISCAILWTRE